MIVLEETKVGLLSSERTVLAFSDLLNYYILICMAMRITSKGGKRYVFVIVDDYSHFTWTLFLASKGESLEKFLMLLRKIEKRVGHPLVSLKSNHGKEFENSSFIDYCNEHGVDHNFSAPRTPQQNGVVERKNQTLEA